MRNIFEANSKEWHIWNLHHEGKSITQISSIMRIPHDYVKDVILHGFRCMG